MNFFLLLQFAFDVSVDSISNLPKFANDANFIVVILNKKKKNKWLADFSGHLGPKIAGLFGQVFRPIGAGTSCFIHGSNSGPTEQNLFLFRNVKTHEVIIVLILTKVEYSITFLMRGSKKTIAPTQVESGAVFKSAVSHYKHIVLYCDITKTEKTSTITQGRKFCRNCNNLSYSNTNG